MIVNDPKFFKQTACALALLAGLAACSPGARSGLDDRALEAAIGERVGDPGTCVMVGAGGSGNLLYRFGSNLTCGRALPDCQGASRTVESLLRLTAPTGAETRASCASSPDGARTVGWASGGIDTRDDLVYAAAMEGPNTPPGVVIADKLAAAFRAAGLSK